jgi:hypothetical protein
MARLTILLAALVLAAAGAAGAADVPRWKVWLCKPGQQVDWCNDDMAVTVISADGSRRVVRAPASPRRPVDCFYVYPSLPGPADDLKIDQAEKQVAVIQASRFGLACRVFAPLYRQNPGATAYADVLAAWRDYLAHDNKGRGVVLIGHSQGAYELERLIREQVEPNAAVRKLLVSAILLGGSVTVRNGSDTGGTFRTLPACRRTAESGCVVAYSTWSRTPPTDANFENLSGPSQHVLCVNPASPAGGRAPITPVFPWFAPEGIVTTDLGVKTIWVAFPGKYTARCVRKGTRAWLLVEDTRRAGDVREEAKEILAPGWGLHAADVNIALEQLVALVRAQAAAWARR